jgi:hypothetical protein
MEIKRTHGSIRDFIWFIGMFSFETSPPLSFERKNKWKFQRDMIADAEKKREERMNRLCISMGNESFSYRHIPTSPRIQYRMLQGTEQKLWYKKSELLPASADTDKG